MYPLTNKDQHYTSLANLFLLLYRMSQGKTSNWSIPPQVTFSLFPLAAIHRRSQGQPVWDHIPEGPQAVLIDS